MGTVGRRRIGLGTIQTLCYEKAHGKEHRQLAQDEVRAETEERYSKAVGMGQQGAWTRWKQFEKRKILWTDFWQM